MPVRERPKASELTLPKASRMGDEAESACFTAAPSAPSPEPPLPCLPSPRPAPASVRYRVKCLHVSVLPAPDSPLMTTDWLRVAEARYTE
eukprot:scaffold22960_cov84-Isochrysis_galbana.AAC.1